MPDKQDLRILYVSDGNLPFVMKNLIGPTDVFQFFGKDRTVLIKELNDKLRDEKEPYDVVVTPMIQDDFSIPGGRMIDAVRAQHIGKVVGLGYDYLGLQDYEGIIDIGECAARGSRETIDRVFRDLYK